MLYNDQLNPFEFFVYEIDGLDMLKAKLVSL